MAMKKDFLPYKKMKDIFMEPTGRDPITWGVGTGKLWVIRLAFNSGTVYILGHYTRDRKVLSV